MTACSIAGKLSSRQRNSMRASRPRSQGMRWGGHRSGPRGSTFFIIEHRCTGCTGSTIRLSSRSFDRRDGSQVFGNDQGLGNGTTISCSMDCEDVIEPASPIQSSGRLKFKSNLCLFVSIRGSLLISMPSGGFGPVPQDGKHYRRFRQVRPLPGGRIIRGKTADR